jgi:hypothetical protein
MDARTDGRTDGRSENIYSIFRDKLLLLGEHILAHSNLNFFLLKMLITATTAVTFLVFAVSITI